MTLSSLFNSLDHLDEVEEEEDFSGVYQLTESAHDAQYRSSRKRRTHAHSSPESKRAKTLLPEHASSTLWPRHGGTGAPSGETADAPNHNTTAGDSSPVDAQLPSSTSASKGIESDHLTGGPSVRDVEPPSSPLASDACSNSGPSSPPIHLENDPKSPLDPASILPHQTKCKAALHEQTGKSPSLEMNRSRAEKVQASVADSAPIPTRSKPDLSQPRPTKLVSQSAAKPVASIAGTKSRSSTILPSNSFRESGSAAPANRDNHVAQGANLSKTSRTQITLVSRKSRHPAKSRQSHGDAKDQCTTVLEFASYLQTQYRDTETKDKRQKPIFRDLIVYYVARDPGRKISHSTKRRMEILSGLSAKVMGTFDSSVTHIISDLAEKPLLEMLGLKSVDAIPTSAWVVGWAWVTKSMNSALRLEETPYERFHKRLVQDSRLSHVPKEGRKSMSVGTDDITETGSELSFREDLDVEGSEHKAPATSGLSITMPPAALVGAPLDPLGSLVALARNMTYSDCSSERGSSPEPLEVKRLSRKDDRATSSKSSPRPHGNGFACLSRNTGGPCVNQALVDELSRLRDIYEAKKHEDPANQFRVMNYNKAIRSITNYPDRITSVDQVLHLAGVGAGIAEKISEFIATGCVAKIAAQTTEDLAVTRLFQGIYGVGPHTAHSWYVRGLRTLADVRNRVGGIELSAAQELGLQYYADLQRRMPRSEAAEIFERIKAAALQLDPKLNIEIMGSFRRGKPTCGDIDILITRPTVDGGSHRGLLRKLLPLLHSQKLLSHDLALPDDEGELEAKYMGLCQLHSDTLMRRIDILTTPYEQWGSALLYFTGSDLFNRSMRLLARKKGMSLNQRGLFQGVVRDLKTQRKISNGILVASRTEREIFDCLEVPWREPHERSIA